jgi:hypothetical protein
VSALINLTVTDYYERGGTRWLRFQEKRGKDYEVPVHSKGKEAVDFWLERSHLASNPSAPNPRPVCMRMGLRQRQARRIFNQEPDV